MSNVKAINLRLEEKLKIELSHKELFESRIKSMNEEFSGLLKQTEIACQDINENNKKLAEMDSVMESFQTFRKRSMDQNQLLVNELSIAKEELGRVKSKLFETNQQCIISLKLCL